MGFKALASTGAGHAFSRGLTDGAVGREGMLAHLREMAAATDLPLSADLENGFGAAPETVANTLRLAATTGIVGGSIEDSSGNRGIGALILQATFNFDSPLLYAAIVMSASLSLLFFLIVATAERLVIRWQPETVQ